MSPPPEPSVTLSILPKNLKPGVVILFVGNHRETVTKVERSGTVYPTYTVFTDLHPNGITATAETYITIEG